MQQTVTRSAGTTAPVGAGAVFTEHAFADGMMVNEESGPTVIEADVQPLVGTRRRPPSTAPHGDELTLTLGSGAQALASNAQLHALQPRPSSSRRDSRRFAG